MAPVNNRRFDPLIIDELAVPGCAGMIGLSLCPGMKDHGFFSGLMVRDLETDLTAVRAWGAAAVVSIIDHCELRLLQVEELPARVLALRMHWLFLPVVDGEVPDSLFEELWQEAGGFIHRLLDEGCRVVLHCKEGLGRTGIVAARLLVERGMPPDQAIRLVRRARPGALASFAQESYVLSLGRTGTTGKGEPARSEDQPGERGVGNSPPRGRKCLRQDAYLVCRGERLHAETERPGKGQGTTSGQAMNGIQEIERFQGCLLGGALGDALGWPVKFRSREEILQDSAPDGILEPRVGTSGYVEVSDDTQLALFSAEGLLLARAQGGHELTACTRHLHRAYLRWLHTQGESPAFMDHGCLEEGWLIDLPPLHARRAPGATCLAALASGRAGTPEHPLNNSRGYGGVVRAAPAGLFIASLQPKRGEGAPLSSAFELGCRLAAITHGHPSGYLPAGVLAATVCRLVQGESLADAVKEALELLRGRPDHEETLLSLEFALALVSWRTPAHYAIQLMGKGCLGHEALAISLYCAMTAGSDFARGVRLAVNHSGDSDSTGAVTGNLLGALLGRSAIPQPWLEKLELRQTLEEMADRLAGRKPAGG